MARCAAGLTRAGARLARLHWQESCGWKYLRWFDSYLRGYHVTALATVQLLVYVPDNGSSNQPCSVFAGRGFGPARALHARRAGPQHAGEAGPDLRDLDQEDGHAHPRRDRPRVGLYLYKILSIFYCNKGGCGENILRNIVGNKGGLGGGYCVLHNNVQ